MTTTILPARPARHSRPRQRGVQPMDVRQMDVDQLWELAEQLQGRPVPGVRMTEDEFLHWCDEDLRAEWIDGEIIMMSPVNDEHDDLNIWLSTLLRMYVEDLDLGLIRTNMNVRLANQRRLRVPDLFFVALGRQHLMRPTYFDGSPDLVIEIVSPDSQSRDRRDKYWE